ncbi:hypothetical protein T265_12613, partial [Opisthorchis viverrini]
MWPVLGSPSRKTETTRASEFPGNGLHTSLPSHCLTASGSLPPFTWLCEKGPSRKSVDWHMQHVAKPAQPMHCDQFIYRGESSSTTCSQGRSKSPSTSMARLVISSFRIFSTPPVDVATRNSATSLRKVIEESVSLTDCSVTDKVNARIRKARVASANLRHLWGQSSASCGLFCCMAVRIGPHRAAELRRLQVFGNRYLGNITRVGCCQRIRNEAVRKRVFGCATGTSLKNVSSTRSCVGWDMFYACQTIVCRREYCFPCPTQTGDGDRLIFTAPAWRRCQIWLPTAVSDDLVVSFSPEKPATRRKTTGVLIILIIRSYHSDMECKLSE